MGLRVCVKHVVCAGNSARKVPHARSMLMPTIAGKQARFEHALNIQGKLGNQLPMEVRDSLYYIVRINAAKMLRYCSRGCQEGCQLCPPKLDRLPLSSASLAAPSRPWALSWTPGSRRACRTHPAPLSPPAALAVELRAPQVHQLHLIPQLQALGPRQATLAGRRRQEGVRTGACAAQQAVKETSAERDVHPNCVGQRATGCLPERVAWRWLHSESSPRTRNVEMAAQQIAVRFIEPPTNGTATRDVTRGLSQSFGP